MPFRSKEIEKEYQKKYREEKREKIREGAKKHYMENKEKIRTKQKEYRGGNKEKITEAKKEYIERNKDKHNEYRRNLYAHKMRNNSCFRLKKSLRQRLYIAVKLSGKIKSQKTMNLLGCSDIELKTHLETKFQKGMTWDNYGLRGWHIDHIIPCSSFDLTKKEEQEKCFHYTNLQPLWWMDNIKKSDKIA